MKVLIAVAAVIAVALAQGPPGPPPFLEGAPKATIDAWNALVQTFGADTEGQINDAINGFIAQHPEIKDKYEAFKTQVLADQKAAEQAHKAKVATLSAGAQAADAQLEAIADNAALTQDQKQQQIAAAFQALPQNVQDELKSASQ
uniref:SXP/RAL-2 family protein Ani s 5-like cation-binding domain-containing protein n=1 Tax=Ascaris lumbricoides TaxID=6252 RepID=A0A9J2PM95_ASCLU